MISEGFVQNGATVYISSRDAKACEQACKELNALGKGKADYIVADFYKEESLKSLAKELQKRESSTHHTHTHMHTCTHSNQIQPWDLLHKPSKQPSKQANPTHHDQNSTSSSTTAAATGASHTTPTPAQPGTA